MSSHYPAYGWAMDSVEDDESVGVVAMVLGSKSEPLDIGRRTRAIPPGIRRALAARFDGCAWPGCDAPLSWCDMHHIIHWASGGDTKLSNLIPLCRRHHTAIHELENSNMRPSIRPPEDGLRNFLEGLRHKGSNRSPPDT